MPGENRIPLPSVKIARRRMLSAFGAAMILLARPRASAAAAMMRIGIIGAGHIGGTVGKLWIAAGHEVMFSARRLDESQAVASALGPRAHAGTVAEAIAFGDAVFLAVPYKAVPEIAKDYGPALKGKIVLDADNAIPGRDGALVDEVERDGIGAVSRRYFPGARLVRVFNTLNYAILAREANRAPPRLAIPVAGDDQAAVAVAAGLVRDAGFDPVIVGDLAQARRFQRGGPGYGQNVTASELRKTLNLTP